MHVQNHLLTWSSLKGTVIPWVGITLRGHSVYDCAWFPGQSPILSAVLTSGPSPHTWAEASFTNCRGCVLDIEDTTKCTFLCTSDHNKGPPAPLVFWMVWCVMALSQAPRVSPTGILWHSAGGEHVPCRDMLLIGRCNDLDEIITHPSSKLCPDLVTYSICRSYCLWWVCFTTAVQTN